MGICAKCLKNKPDDDLVCPGCGHFQGESAYEYLENRPAEVVNTTNMSTDSDKIVVEDYYEKKRSDAGNEEILTQELPGKDLPFLAWAVFTGEEGRALHYTRLIKDKNILGKGDEADIHVDDEFSSRQHALVFFEKKRFYISDLSSTNGTFLNDSEVKKEALNDGDRIRIGRQKIIFKQVRRDL